MELFLNSGRALTDVQSKNVSVNHGLGVRMDTQVVGFVMTHKCAQDLPQYELMLVNRWQQFLLDKVYVTGLLNQPDFNKKDGEVGMTIKTPVTLPPPRSEIGSDGMTCNLQDIPMDVSVTAAPDISGKGNLLAVVAKMLGSSNIQFNMVLNHKISGSGIIPSSEVQCVWSEVDQRWEGFLRRVLVAGRLQEDGSCPEIISRVEKLVMVLRDGGMSGLMRGGEKFQGRWRVMQSLLEEEVNCDLLIAGSNGMPIKCHWSIVAPTSPVLQDLLPPSYAQEEVKILDLSEPGLRALLKFIYFSDSEDIWRNVELAVEMLEAGYRYLMPNLMEVATIALMVKPSEKYTVDAAVNLFRFTSTVGADKTCGDPDYPVPEFDLKHKSISVFNWFRSHRMDVVEASSTFRDLKEKSDLADSGLSAEMISFLEGNTKSEEQAPVPPNNLFEVLDGSMGGSNCSIS